MAQVFFDDEARQAPNVEARFTLGAGVGYSPDYFGAGDSSFGPTGTFRFDYIRLPGGFEFGSTAGTGPLQGFGLRGSARYIGSRKASDNSELVGLEDVDTSFEWGLGVGYDTDFYRVFGHMRYGVVGHNSWVGDVGADAIFRPSEALTVTFGPRAEWGADGFMDTYFGVGQAEANPVSSFDAYDPSSSFYSAGVELGVRYALSSRWGVESYFTYNRLIGDAEDSPIVQQGSRDQFGVRLMLTRSIAFGL